MHNTGTNISYQCSLYCLCNIINTILSNIQVVRSEYADSVLGFTGSDWKWNHGTAVISHHLLLLHCATNEHHYSYLISMLSSIKCLFKTFCWLYSHNTFCAYIVWQIASKFQKVNRKPTWNIKNRTIMDRFWKNRVETRLSITHDSGFEAIVESLGWM